MDLSLLIPLFLNKSFFLTISLFPPHLVTSPEGTIKPRVCVIVRFLFTNLSIFLAPRRRNVLRNPFSLDGDPPYVSQWFFALLFIETYTRKKTILR